MFRRLMGLEPLNITEQVRYRLLGWVLAMGLLDVAVPGAHDTLGLPQTITMTVQVIAWIGTLLAFIWAVILANRPSLPGKKEL
jgi:hypothetical protein